MRRNGAGASPKTFAPFQQTLIEKESEGSLEKVVEESYPTGENLHMVLLEFYPLGQPSKLEREVSDTLLFEGGCAVSESSKLDRTFQIILKTMVDTGQAPHYTELASELGVTLEEGRKALHQLFTPNFVGWLFPNTDLIVTFPPFSNLPTQYRITIEGQQKWFAQ